MLAGTKYLKSITVVAAMMASTSALANWEGTWETSYGELKLHQNDAYIYGDYGSWGTIQGVLSENERTMRGIYRRNDDGTSGYIEWRMGGTTLFKGRWTKTGQAMPRWNSLGTEWTGKRVTSVKPRLSVYRQGRNLDAFLSRQNVRYTNWAKAINNRPKGRLASRPSSKSNASTSANATTAPREHPLAKRIPMFARFAPNFKPRYLDLSLVEIFMRTGLEQSSELYGTAGVYLYCETRSGSRKLATFGGQGNRVLDYDRATPLLINGNAFNNFRMRDLDESQNTVRFLFDDKCLDDPEARISVQLQTNLKEKDLIAKRDERFGYRSHKIYLDQVKDGYRSKNFLIKFEEQRPVDQGKSWVGDWLFRTSNKGGGTVRVKYRIEPVF